MRRYRRYFSKRKRLPTDRTDADARDKGKVDRAYARFATSNVTPSNLEI
jgi:hypothetical protein